MAVEQFATAAEPSSMPLMTAMRRAERGERIKALALIAPLFLFLLFVFVVPILSILYQAVYNGELYQGLPNFSAALSSDEDQVPAERVFRLLAQDLADARAREEDGKTIKPLRHQALDIWALFKQTINRLPSDEPESFKAWFIGQNPSWGEPETWTVIRRVAAPYTAYYLLHALDMRHSPDGSITQRPKTERLYIQVFVNTFEISLVVTIVALVLGYPVAYLLASLRDGRANILLILVLLPFWTSVLVRCYAWLTLLQTNGVVNKLMIDLGVFGQPVQMIHNRLGVYIVMVHVLLPFMILPIYSVMKGIKPHYVKAAANLGASPARAFLTVYLPLSLPGIGAGCLLVFITSLGYYITPVLVGGARDAMVSVLIALNINQLVNWGMAGALGTILLIATLLFFVVYNKLIGLEKVRL